MLSQVNILNIFSPNETMLRMSDPFPITERKDVLEQAFKWMSAGRNTHWVQFEIKLPLIPSCTAFVAVVTWLLKRDTGARVLLRDNPSSERGFRLNVPVKSSVFQLAWWMAYCSSSLPCLGWGLEAEAPGSPDCSLSTVFVPSFPRVPRQEHLEQFSA